MIVSFWRARKEASPTPEGPLVLVKCHPHLAKTLGHTSDPTLTRRSTVLDLPPPIHLYYIKYLYYTYSIPMIHYNKYL